MKPVDLLQYRMPSPLGPLYLTASATGLCELSRERGSAPLLKTPEGKILGQAFQQLEEYFSGKRTRFSLPLDLQGTPFQLKVWQALQNIPYGKTVSYTDIAKQIGNPKAVRAVGGANGKNPVCIIVPCHRVIAADGSIGGYSGELAMKRKLLALENSRL